MAAVGQDQYLPDDMDERMGFDTTDNGMNGHTQGGGYGQQQKPTSGGGVVMQDSTDLSETQKLQLAERANEIYRQQLKYMQDHLASLRSLIQDKENIIENLMLRYDLGIITQDSNRQGGNLGPDEIEMEELRRKAEALAQRTILENFELREMVNELRDENFHLRNEIYELQDKINRQVLQINKLEKTAQQTQMSNPMNDMEDRMEDADINPYGVDDDDDEDDDDDNDNDIYDVEEDEQMDDQYIDDQQANNMSAHDRGSSITGADWLNNESSLTGRRASRTMDHPSNSEEARAKRLERQAKHERKESTKPPDLFGDGSDPDEYMDDDAIKKREERQNKSRKESIATPDIYGDAQGESEEDDGSAEEDNKQEAPQTGTKRRGSQIYMDESALAKRQERQAKSHRRDSSIATPDIFRQNYNPEKLAQDKAKKDSKEAQQKRLKRKAKKVGAAAVKHVKSHRRKESLAEKLLLGPMEDDFDIKAADPEQRKELQSKARKEQRRKSRQLIKSQVGAKEHFSDDDVDLQEEKPQRTAHKARKKMKSSQRQQAVPDNVAEFDMNKEMAANYAAVTNNKKRNSIKADPPVSIDDDGKNKTHRRDSSAPVVSLGFDDPDVLLNFEKLKVEDLEGELEKRLNELDVVKRERDSLQTAINSQTNTAETAIVQSQKAEIQLEEAVQSKAALAQKCAMEIMRLTMILNTLQQMPKFKEIVQILMDESMKDNN